MIRLERINAVRSWRAQAAGAVGFVPTMGALHEGHLELVRRSLADNDRTVVSIYVNPTQFDDGDDLAAYPDTLDADLAALNRAGVDAVLLPRWADLYADNYRFRMTETDQSAELCGAHRTGHFDGVLTVVMKLLNLVSPDRAYFGEKDYQQLSLVRDMAGAFFMPVEIVAVPTVREPDGLAMSSRNRRLSQRERRQAPELYRVLQNSVSADEAAQALRAQGFEVEYVEDRGERRLAAVRLGDTRLIDNIALDRRGRRHEA